MSTNDIKNPIEVELPPLKLERQNADGNKHFIGNRKPIQYYIQLKKKQKEEEKEEVEPAQKSTKKKNDLDIQEIKFFAINFPEKLSLGQKKKYKIKLGYYDSNAKKRFKCIKFGLQDKKDYVDDQQQGTKNKVMKSLRNYQNPFQPNFWRYKLLNTGDNLKTNYIQLLQVLLE